MAIITRIAFFLLAVALIIISVYTAVIAVLHEVHGGDLFTGLVGWQPDLFARVTTGTALLIRLSSALRPWQLRVGGSAIARMLGGRAVDPDTQDASERRLLDVVEEVAIASGAPVPELGRAPSPGS